MTQETVSELPGLCVICEKTRTHDKLADGIYFCDGCLSDLRAGRLDPRQYSRKVEAAQKKRLAPQVADIDAVFSAHAREENLAFALLCASAYGRDVADEEEARMALCSRAFKLSRSFLALSSELLTRKQRGEGT